ncbi:ribosomal protein S5 domain 2-type protein [Lipomyces japonicus]|uniref:ribosomal protein S5 domain 2-type protein n=1 Tax=Lipomyces japonicus TaxID=56871 RepID=UPI0034CDCF37
MPLSVAEESYLSSSLALKPPVRPDGRQNNQFRSLDAASGILPLTNGSARIRLGDGGECIVGVKAEVVTNTTSIPAIEVDVDIMGVPSSSPLVTLLTATVASAIKNSIPAQLLGIQGKYAYKLYIDGVILDHVSHPLTLFSMATYLALLDTKLPKLTSTKEDEDIGLPQFSSDWEDSTKLCHSWAPPLVQLVVLVGKNVFVDATSEEADVSDGGIIMVTHEGKVTGLRVTNTKESKRQVFSIYGIRNSVEVASKVASELEIALKGVQ